MTTEATVEAVRGLASAIGVALRDSDWVSVALVADRVAGSDRISGLAGYAYEADESYTPTHIGFDALDAEYNALIQATVVDGDAGEWIKCLFQAERATGKVKFFFEFEEEDRWRMIPPDWTGLPNEIRPDFPPTP